MKNNIVKSILVALALSPWVALAEQVTVPAANGRAVFWEDGRCFDFGHGPVINICNYRAEFSMGLHLWESTIDTPWTVVVSVLGNPLIQRDVACQLVAADQDMVLFAATPYAHVLQPNVPYHEHLSIDVPRGGVLSLHCLVDPGAQIMSVTYEHP
jgi:hypothetical protein